MTEPGSKPTGKAALRAEIDKLTSGTEPADDEKKADKPVNPRDFINKWMAEHDKKLEE